MIITYAWGLLQTRSMEVASISLHIFELIVRYNHGERWMR